MQYYCDVMILLSVYHTIVMCLHFGRERSYRHRTSGYILSDIQKIQIKHFSYIGSYCLSIWLSRQAVGFTWNCTAATIVWYCKRWNRFGYNPFNSLLPCVSLDTASLLALIWTFGPVIKILGLCSLSESIAGSAPTRCSTQNELIDWFVRCLAMWLYFSIDWLVYYMLHVI